MTKAPPDEVLRPVRSVGINWIDSPPSAHGRPVLTRWTREQSVT